jgi:hypothetical protein
MPRVLAGIAAVLALGALDACGSSPGTAAAASASAGSDDAPAGAAPQRAGAGATPAAAGTERTGAGSASAPAPGKPLFRVVGFRTPRSVLHDPVADVYLVSNVNGDPAGADDDDNGFISRISPDGKVLDLKWIDGADSDALQLSAPMGMALSAGRLWVADRNQVHAFDARTGRHRASYKIRRATELADVAVLDGAILVSDNGTELAGDLFRIGSSRRPRPYLAPDQPGIGHPQGLYAPGDGSLWVTADRELYRVVKGRRTAGGELPKDDLDGIAGLPGGELLVASHGGSIFRGAPRPREDGALDVTWTELFTDLEAPGDIGYDAKRNRVLIPLVLANAIEIRELPPQQQ